MSDKPSYLGLLNAVSLAETRAHCYLTEWAAVTTDPEVRRVLSAERLAECFDLAWPLRHVDALFARATPPAAGGA